MPQLITTLGPKRADELDVILPHEHIFTDLRTWDQLGYAQADTAEVIAQVSPEITRACQAGISALVESTPVGVGRRVDILKAVSEATGFPIVASSGIYREPWVPTWAHEASEDELFLWMLDELDGEIENSGVQAGFIKLSAGDEGLSTCEAKILCAAARAALASEAAIGSHTVRGWVVREELAILEERSFAPQRFIWIHANLEPDFALNLEMARRGVWIEYDGIGGEQGDDYFIERIQRMLDAGLGDRLLLSQDRWAFNPALPNGGTSKPFTYLTDIFIPRLRAAGVDDPTIRRLTVDNPFTAFAR
jgi:phosphotriesterase-related protein